MAYLPVLADRGAGHSIYGGRLLVNLDSGRPLRPKGLMALAVSCSLAIGILVGIASDIILPLKVKVSDKAPDFVLPSADGRTVRLSDYAGHNVLIDFYRGYW